MPSAHDIAMHLRGAYRTMHRRADAHFAQYGVTADQFVLLTAIAQGEAVPQQQLVNRSFSDPNTVREMLSRLERKGLVIRQPHLIDRRARSVSLTDEGRRLQKQLWAANETFQTILVEMFQPDDLMGLLHNLKKISDVLSSPECQPDAAPNETADAKDATPK